MFTKLVLQNSGQKHKTGGCQNRIPAQHLIILR